MTWNFNKMKFQSIEDNTNDPSRHQKHNIISIGTNKNCNALTHTLDLPIISFQDKQRNKINNSDLWLNSNPKLVTKCTLNNQILSSKSRAPVIPKKILIVDDDRINRVFLCRLLQKRGHFCVEAENGLLGLNMVNQSITQSLSHSLSMKLDDIKLRHYDVILMDLLMPVMDGLVATRQIRQIGFTGPIIGVTACTLPEDGSEELFQKAGANQVFFKPVKMNEIYTALDSL
jgi:CheY-like chemotaxis protein